MPHLPTDPFILLCINLVLPMVWVNSHDFFCAESDIVADNANGYSLDPASTFMVYSPTAGTYKTVDVATAFPKRLQYVNIYMNDLLCVAQGDPNQQQRVSEITIHALKKTPPPCQVR